MVMRDFTKEKWFKFLDKGQRGLVREGFHLLKMAKQHAAVGERLIDYSFVVFPMAKAYEGVLKKFFLRLGEV
jgi:hypothetical protein